MTSRMVVCASALLCAIAGCGANDEQPAPAPARHRADEHRLRFSEPRTLPAPLPDPEPAALPMNSSADDVAALIDTLRADDAESRVAAIGALTSLGRKARPAVPALIELLKDGDKQVRQCAVDALWSIGVEPGRLPKLIELLDDEQARGPAVDVLGGMRRDAAAAVPRLVELLAAGDEYERQRIGFALASIGRPALPELTRLVEDAEADPATRIAGIRALGLLHNHGEDAGPVLKHALADADRAIQLQAALALGRVRVFDPAAVGLLVEELEASASPHHAECIESLGGFGPRAESAVAALIELLGTRRHRAAVAHTLGAIGPAAADAVPPLLKSLDGETPYVRRTICDAVEKIDPQAAGGCR